MFSYQTAKSKHCSRFVGSNASHAINKMEFLEFLIAHLEKKLKQIIRNIDHTDESPETQCLRYIRHIVFKSYQILGV